MYPEIDPTEYVEKTGRGGAFGLNFDNEDAVLAIRFYSDVRKNEQESKKQGRLVCDDVEMLEIRIPGGSDIIRREVSDQDRERFQRQYKAFVGGMSQDGVSGTPLAQWPLMTRAQVEEAGYFGIRTVEAMAGVQDSNLQRMGPGWKDVRKKAVDWLQKAKDGALLNRMRDELEERDRRIDALEKMLHTQGREIEAARNAGGALPPAPVDIASIVREQLAQAMAPKPVELVPVRKKGGWPKGKPRKPVLPVEPT